MNLKITLIGAGSVVFAKRLIGDILQFSELSDATLCLMDIDPARLRVAETMAHRMVEALGVKAKVVARLNQREAVKGARYVICTIQVGGYKPATVIDFEIPRKYGLLQTIGDTLGVGGVFRALRTIPVINSIAQDIAEVGAPGCLLLNYTNPMAMNCMGVARGVGIPHVGLCHSVQSTSQMLASLVGLPYAETTFLVAGINHMAFFLKFEYRGQDAYPLLFRLLEQGGFGNERVRFEMMRRTGYFVTESSEHQSEYVPYFIHHGKKVIDQFDIPIDEYLRRCEAIITTWEKTEAELIGNAGRIKVSPQSHEFGSFIIHSRETNTARVIYGNVPNDGLIDNLPAGCCVELPCLVDGQGIQPTHIGSLPPQLAAICQTNINVQTLAVEAALSRKRERIYHAVMLDPHAAAVLTLDKIWAMCDELIAAHQKHGFLGEFAPAISGTGRAFAGVGDRCLAEAELAPGKGRVEGKIEAQIVLTNPRSKAVTVKLGVKCTGLAPGSELVEATVPVTARVPARRTIIKKVSLPRPAAAKEGFAVRLSTASPEVFVRDFIIPRRRILSAGAAEGAPFDLELAGNPAVEGSLAVRGSSVVLRLAVDDTKITPSARPSEGSSIELYFASLGKPDTRQFFLVPKAGRRGIKVLDGRLKPVPAIRAKIGPARRGAGYEVEAVIPLSVANISEKQPAFLFNTIVNLCGLGDAHGGGRTSLSGRFEPSWNAGAFAQVDINVAR